MDQSPAQGAAPPVRQVLDKGFVALLDHLGDDLTVVNSARVSFNKRCDELQVGDDKLIGYLLKNRHGTPFEHSVFTFHIKCPIFVAREWHRHRIGSYNEVSMRYTTITPEFYVPKVEDVRVRVGKPGAYTYEKAPTDLAVEFIGKLNMRQRVAAQDYEDFLVFGVAPELARTFLPVSVFTEFYWTVNARALMNFLSLRTAGTAQKEIRDYGDATEDLWRAIMPLTHKHWLDNGKVAP